ncbi:EVE domain-containing protein [Camelliibacillus cellulosilyticus]|uniref:EVE domain-containing protein n=1 Tax=Camelliibacillus cellulosilyticus TaxID=2174486 RepID=A0ABV9GNB0_9BACL
MIQQSIERNIWFMVASDTAATFRWEHILSSQRSTFWWIRRLPRNFKTAKPGELILCYRSGNERRGLVGLAEVEDAFNDDGITVKGLLLFKKIIPYEAFKNEPIYKQTEAGRHRNRGTLFAVDRDFTHWVRMKLEEYGDERAANYLYY